MLEQDPEALRHLAFGARQFRYVALYAIDVHDPTERRASLPASLPVSSLFEASPAHASYREWMGAADAQLPSIVALRRNGPPAISLPNATELVTVREAWTWAFDMRVAGFQVALALDLELKPEAQLSHALLSLFDDLDTDRNARRINGQPLPSICPGLSDESLGFDFHAVVVLLDPIAVELRKTEVQGLVSRRWHLSHPRFVTAQIDASDRFPDGIVAVTPGATVLAGIAEDMAMAIVLAAAQSISSLALLRHLQDAAFQAAEQARWSEREGPHRSEAERSRELEASAEQLAGLELDLSLGVERFEEMRVFIPVWRVEQYHKLLLDALGISRATAVTATMLDRVKTAVEARRAAMESRLQRRAMRSRRRISTIASTVAFFALPLTIVLAFLGMSVAPVGDRGSALRGELLIYYVLILAPLGLAGLAGWIYFRRHPEDPAMIGKASRED